MNNMSTIVGLGEVLWDVLPDGPRLGGAPVNFARSVASLGKNRVNACVVSSIGQDDLGRQAMEILNQSGINTSCVLEQENLTGQVFVKLDAEGCASYEFASNTAWDNLVWSDELEQLANRTDAVCFGTLGQRSEPSCKVIQQFISKTPQSSLRICDINLRAPFYNDSIIQESIELANVLKLNDEELPIVAKVCGFSGTTLQLLEQLTQRYSLRMVAFTCGAEGAVLFCDNNIYEEPSVKTNIADTVGAGDAFTATLALGMLENQPPKTIIQNACQVAGFVCSQSGAAPEIPSDLNIFGA